MNASKAPVFLVADDDADTRALLKRILEDGFPGCTVASVADADSVPEAASTVRPQVAFLDWVFPHGKTGAEVCRKLKAQRATRDTAIVLLTGRRLDVKSRFKAARCGADLFLTKPASIEEVLGYAKALLERVGDASRDATVRLGALTLDHEQRSACLGARALPKLPRRLYELLWHLARRSPEPVPTQDLIRWVWADAVRDRHLAVAVTRLRSRLSAFPSLELDHVPGVGYRLVVR